MKKKTSDIMGVPLYSIFEGKKIALIDDVVYQAHENRIEAFLVNSRKWFSETKIILFKDIKKIGADAVLVETEELLKKESEVEDEIESIAKSNTYLTGTKILTENGSILGNVSDVFFDTETGVVNEFEISDIDNEEQKRSIKIADILSVGRDATIVRIEDEVEGHSKHEKSRHKIEISEKRKQQIIGMYLTKNVLTEDDRLIAKEGDIVTNKLLQKAEEEGVLSQILDNAVPSFSIPV